MPGTLPRLFNDPRFASFGVTGMSVGKDNSIDELRQRLLTWCRARKHLERANSWTGIGVMSSRPDAVAVLVQLDEPWTEDPDLDQLVELLQMRPYAEVASPFHQSRRKV